MYYLLDNEGSTSNRYALLDLTANRWSFWQPTIALTLKAQCRNLVTHDKLTGLLQIYTIIASSSTRITIHSHPELLI